MGDGEDRRFGELPLAQTVEAAAAMRRLSSMLVSLEHPHDVVDAMVAQFADWERELAPALPQDPAPRMSTDDGSKRIYVQRAFDIVRTEVERGITATARLSLGDRVLCIGEADAVSRHQDQLSASRFGKRRTV
ncbi:hypothetical protein ACTXG7_04175 [Mycolicibacterium sp. Dal123E01]|uniref:hypothetical protein n=1 Tax=Mycolicibacterium sp. Dal123E01 TaxID=3457578 RepID=UPI00403EF6E0